jgi:hypothetical protein
MRPEDAVRILTAGSLRQLRQLGRETPFGAHPHSSGLVGHVIHRAMADLQSGGGAADIIQAGEKVA